MKDNHPEIDPYTKEDREPVSGIGDVLLFVIVIAFFFLQLIAS